MKIILVIAAGSMIGGILRYMLSQMILAKSQSFPYATLSVNIIGCLCIGLVFGLAENGNLGNGWKIFLATGLLGGFTTFSAFSLETLQLMRSGQQGYALLYVATSVLLGLLATFLGFLITKAG